MSCLNMSGAARCQLCLSSFPGRYIRSVETEINSCFQMLGGKEDTTGPTPSPSAPPSISLQFNIFSPRSITSSQNPPPAPCCHGDKAIPRASQEGKEWGHSLGCRDERGLQPPAHPQLSLARLRSDQYVITCISAAGAGGAVQTLMGTLGFMALSCLPCAPGHLLPLL